MIVKRFILGNSEELPELLKVSSKGIDTSHLEKTASSDMLSKADIKPESGCSYIHLVTTGAEEYYGNNNNADSFNESSHKVTFPMAEKEASYQLAGGLKEYHKTYRDYGGVYKNHNNSKKGYDKQGEIVYENYNPDMHRGELIIKVANDLKDSEGKPVWHDTIEKLAQDKPVLFSQGCFTAGTLVLTPKGYFPIEEINPGDKVITHKGEDANVISTKVLDLENEPVNTIKASGGFKTTSTDYHPYLVVEKEDLDNSSDIDSIGKWKEAKDVRVGEDYVVMPRIDICDNINNIGKEIKRVIYDNYILTEVKENESGTLSDKVYDLEIDKEEHSYTANNMSVHNCSVPYDIASCCGRIAHKSSEHCDCFKNHKLEFLKSGQQIFVYNDQPYFHDISEVDKPADRIAMALQKVAGENSGGYPSELNKEAVTPEGLSIPYHLMEKLGTKDQQDRSRVLLKLSELEKRVPMIAEDVKEPLSCGRDLSEGEEEEVIKNLKDIPEDIIIDSLQKRNMMLTPKGFCAILLKKNPSEISGFDSIKKALENVFTKIREEKDPNEILSDGLYKPIAPLRHPGAEDRIKKLSGLLSLDPEPLQSRIVKITVRGDGEDKKEKEAASAEITPEVEKIAEEYAKYQLSFLSSGKEDNGKLLLTVLSNQQ